MAPPPPEPTPAALPAYSKKASWATARHLRERAIEGLLLVSAAVAVIITAGILYVLISNSVLFFEHVSVWDFLTGTKWSPDIAPISFGVLPLVNGTLIVTLGSSLLAVPIGVATAIYLSEFAHPRVRAVLKPAVELLAGVPSIAFGIFALFIISPILQDWFDAEVYNAANAIIVLSFMVLPIITSLSEDALRAVPQHLRAGALALGATKWEVTRQVVVPAALSGIVAAILLGFSRAIGETMAVTLAGGARPTTDFNLIEPLQTMTSFIVQRAQGDTVHEGPSYLSLFAVGLLLFIITFGVNLVAQRVLKRYREAY